jgi:hypothetical protein
MKLLRQPYARLLMEEVSATDEEIRISGQSPFWRGAAAEAANAQEDKLHGASRRSDEMPGWIADKQKRLAKIRETREALEAEAAAAAAAKAEAERAAEEKRKAENRKRSGPVPRPPSKEIPWGRITPPGRGLLCGPIDEGADCLAADGPQPRFVPGFQPTADLFGHPSLGEPVPHEQT